LPLTLEINPLSALQIKAVKDATFMGWDVQEKAAYEERGRRIVLLRTELSLLADSGPKSSDQSKAG
jgi:hypothetical protein